MDSKMRVNKTLPSSPARMHMRWQLRFQTIMWLRNMRKQMCHVKCYPGSHCFRGACIKDDPIVVPVYDNCATVSCQYGSQYVNGKCLPTGPVSNACDRIFCIATTRCVDGKCNPLDANVYYVWTKYHDLVYFISKWSLKIHEYIFRTNNHIFVLLILYIITKFYLSSIQNLVRL